jgi:ABC-type branched-subunit amino acid transport system ATPase component
VQRARLGIGRTFQEPRSFPDFTVEENLAVGLMEFTSDNCFRRGLRHFSLDPFQDRIDSLLSLGRLLIVQKRAARELSYGQRKILDFLFLLARRPRALLLDEPFAGVDPKSLETILELLRLEEARKSTVIIVSHEMALVRQVADEVMLMDEGRIVKTGAPDEVLESPEYKEAYLG